MNSNEKKAKQSMTFESFLRLKEKIVYENDKAFETPIKVPDMKSFEKNSQSPKKLSDSVNKMKKFIDSSLKRPTSPNKNIPKSYLNDDFNDSIQKEPIENIVTLQKQEDIGNDEKKDEFNEKKEELNEKTEENIKNEDNTTIETKRIRYPTLTIETKSETTQKPHEKPSNLQDRKQEFSEYLDSLDWKSKAVPKEKMTKSGYLKNNDLSYTGKLTYIQELNAKICDFKESDRIYNENLRNFKESYKIKEMNIFPKEVDKKKSQDFITNKSVNCDLSLLLKYSKNRNFFGRNLNLFKK